MLSVRRRLLSAACHLVKNTATRRSSTISSAPLCAMSRYGLNGATVLRTHNTSASAQLFFSRRCISTQSIRLAAKNHTLNDSNNESKYTAVQDNAYTTLGVMLRNAVYRKDLPQVKQLIAAGADVNFRGSEGHRRTPLEIAITEYNSEMVKFLVEANADLNLKSSFFDGENPLQLAEELLSIARADKDPSIKDLNRYKEIEIIFQYLLDQYSKQHKEEQSRPSSHWKT